MSEDKLIDCVRDTIRTWGTSFSLDQVYATADSEAHRFPLHRNVEARHGVMRRLVQDEQEFGLTPIKRGLYKYRKGKDHTMLDTTGTPETAMGAAFRQASERNKPDALDALQAAIIKAKPLRPDAPVLTLPMLKNFLKSTPDNQRSEDVTVIPEMAQYLLDYHPWPENRTLDEKRVARYCGFICDSDWELDGTPVKMNDREQLHNGRHRLTGCVRAGKPFATTMRFGVPWQSYKTEDTGKPWTANDAFQKGGWKYYQTIPHIVRRIEYYRNGAFESRDTDASNNDRLCQATALGKRKLERSAEIGAAIKGAMASKKRKPDERYKVQAQYTAQAHYLAAENNLDEANKFFTAWAESPSKLHNIASQMIHTASKPRDTIGCAIAILAWNIHRKNKKATAAEIRQWLHWELGYPAPTVAD